MDKTTLETTLAEQPIFKGLSQEHIELLAGCAKNVKFAADEVIFRTGEAADVFYIIRHGTVAVEAHDPSHRAITIQTLQDGDVLGWSWLVPPYLSHFDARAVTLTRAIALDGECLRQKCEADKRLGYEVLRRFSQIIVARLEAMRLQVLDVYR